MTKIIQKALKVRIYPTKEQSLQINKTIGCCRFFWNNMLGERKEVYDKLKDDKEALKKHKFKTEKQWKEEHPFLKEVEAQALCQTRMDLDNAFNGFFQSQKKQRKGEELGFPNFKSKRNSKKTYRSPEINNNIRIDYDERVIRMPILKDVKFRHGSIKEWYKQGVIKNVTISSTSTGKYYASLLFEIETNQELVETNVLNPKTKGLDMSLSKFYIDDEGSSPSYPKPFRTMEKRLKKLQRCLSKKVKGSKNRDKSRLKVAKTEERIGNIREDFLHKTSYKLIKECDILVVETLMIKEMMKNRCWSKSVQDLGWNKFVQMLNYKALWNGKQVLMADKWFASSKLCSVCGWKNQELKISDRSWICLGCGTSHNRDINAARNLKKIGQEVTKFTPVETCGSMKQEAPNL